MELGWCDVRGGSARMRKCVASGDRKDRQLPPLPPPLEPRKDGKGSRFLAHAVGIILDEAQPAPNYLNGCAEYFPA